MHKTRVQQCLLGVGSSLLALLPIVESVQAAGLIQKSGAAPLLGLMVVLHLVLTPFPSRNRCVRANQAFAGTPKGWGIKKART